MCGRYRRHSDKQRIAAELFAASAELEELYFGPKDGVTPGSVQPVIRINSRGERKISLMRWGFKRDGWQAPLQCPSRKHHRRELLEKSFSVRRCIVPADSFLEWQKTQQSKKPKFEFTVRDTADWPSVGLS
jgi:putative SOS response-associated peptidase YedK